eukprot:2337008-Heterocapsa_arctica.AAC.1
MKRPLLGVVSFLLARSRWNEFMTSQRILPMYLSSISISPICTSLFMKKIIVISAVVGRGHLDDLEVLVDVVELLARVLSVGHRCKFASCDMANCGDLRLSPPNAHSSQGG